GALVLVSHDRHLLDRVSTQVVALDGRGGAQHYAAYDQWEATRTPQASPKRDTTRASTPKAQRSGARRLAYLEQREWDGLEAAVLNAEVRVAEARRRAEDPSIATDSGMLQKRLSELGDLQAQVDRLYARWADLDEKQK
ncbi:MAG: ABC transporter ATP-binding protein, partial [Acidobacteriota bacterium]